MTKSKKLIRKQNKKSDNTKHNYIYTTDDRFKPIRPLHYNPMNNSRHDNLVKILRDDIINSGSELVIWNMDYGWYDAKGNIKSHNIGELDVQEYCDSWKALGLYEAKGTNSYRAFDKGKLQMNRAIDKYLKEFDRSFNLDLKHLYTFIVNLPKKNSYAYEIHKHRHIRL